MLHEVIQATPVLEDIAVPITAKLPDGPPDIIPGLLPKDDLLAIVGETNVGKTLLGIEFCSSLITGNKLWGQLQPNIKVNKILYVLGEHRTRKLLQLAHKTKLPLTDKVLVLGPEMLAGDKYLVIQGRQNIQVVNKFKRWAEGCDFIVFDPMASFIIGSESENDSPQMRLLIETINEISMSTGASCLVLGHKGKPSMDFNGKEHTRKTYATRGASGTEDAATNILYFNKADSPKGGAGNQYELIVRKFKGESPSEYQLVRDPVTLTHRLVDRAKPLSDLMKMEAQAKVSRIQAGSPMIDFRTAVKLVADMEGVALETMYRRLGISA